MKTLSLHYLPCIYWFKQFYNHDTIIDCGEYYIKQSYRNRCVILTANGPLALTIPVKKKQHIRVGEIAIENSFNWQKQHWEAIQSAYNSSSYFIHYKHYFEPLYKKEFVLLQDFNLELIRICLKILKIKKELNISTNYVETSEGDLREVIHPKHQVEDETKSYLQVFSEKFPFESNLSIVDAIFNLGPETLSILA